MSKTCRMLAASVETAGIRTETLLGRTHLVIPVVASVADIAITAQGSDGHSELVPADELAVSTSQWNGRPVVFRHPTTADGEPLSANDPDVLDQFGMGWIFASRFENGRLKVEAWIDPERVAILGPDAQAALDSIKMGEMIEVSVGCRISVEETSGRDATGRPYDRAWTNIRPDHLAFLPVGEIGACSNKAGCGAPRMSLRAAAHRMEATTMNLFQRLLSKLRIGNEESGPSDDELRYKLATVLHSTEPAFDGVIAVYPESSTVIYSVSPDNNYQTKRRGYTLAEDGEVALADDAEIVEARVEFVPLKPTSGDANDEDAQASASSASTASASAPATPPAPPPASASCGCGDHRKAADHHRGEQKMTNKELAERLIACKGSPFTEEDRENLEAFSADRLSALADQLDPQEKVVEPEPEPKPRTAEQWLADAPSEVREMISRYQTEEKARHATLVAHLKEIPQVKAIYDEARLASLTVPALTEIATLVGLGEQVSYDGVVVPDTARSAEGTPKSAPRPYDIALKARRDAAQGKAN